MSNCDTLFENQSFDEKTGLYKNTFMLVHDDQFGRIQTLSTITKYLEDDYALEDNKKGHFEIEVLSTIPAYSEERMHVNVFVLHLYHEQPVEDFQGYRGMEIDYSHLFPNLNKLVDVQYYRATAIKWQPVVAAG